MQRILICLFILTTLITGCSKRDEHPELRDPIYKYMVDQTKTASTELESQKKALEEAKAAHLNAEPNTREKKQGLKKISEATMKIHMLSQEVEFLKIHTERRRVETRRDYLAAFLAGKSDEWPKANEFELFLAHEKLRKASLNWNARVPKLQSRIDQAWAKPDKKAKKEEPSKEKGE